MVNERTILAQLLALKIELQNKLDKGLNLKQLSQYTFEQRESGREIPYFSVLNKVKNEITTIAATPTAKQKELKEFFSLKAEGSVLPKYFMCVDLEGSGKVELKQRLGKGKDNFILV